MESLANLESFIRSAECGSFSAAARRLGVTPAAVSRNVAMLERNLSVRLFHRSSRSLALTEDGERFLASVSGGVESIRSAIADVTKQSGTPAGILKLSMPQTFGLDHVLPVLPSFMARYPDVQLDLSLENRQVDLIGEGFDAAIGGGMDLAAGVVARRLAPLHVIAVASPACLAGRAPPQHPLELASLDGVGMRSALTGRVRVWRMRNRTGAEATLEHEARLVSNDPEAICRAALMGLGAAMIAHSLCRAAPGQRRADPPAARLACRSRGDIVLFPQPETSARQDPRVHRAHRRRIPRAGSGATLFGRGVMGDPCCDWSGYR